MDDVSVDGDRRLISAWSLLILISVGFVEWDFYVLTCWRQVGYEGLSWA